MNQVLIDFAHYLPVSDLSDDEEREVEHSRQSFLLCYREKKIEEHQIDILEGNKCSDSESDNPDEWIDVDLRTEAGKTLIQKKEGSGKKQSSKLWRNAFWDENFLSM